MGAAVMELCFGWFIDMVICARVPVCQNCEEFVLQVASVVYSKYHLYGGAACQHFPGGGCEGWRGIRIG